MAIFARVLIGGPQISLRPARTTLAAASSTVGKSILMCKQRSEQSTVIPSWRSAASMAPATTSGRPQPKGPGSVAMSMRMVAATYHWEAPGNHFVLDHHPSIPGLVYACGFTRHAFKLAQAIGAVLTDLPLDKTTCLPVDFCRARRFTKET